MGYGRRFSSSSWWFFGGEKQEMTTIAKPEVARPPRRNQTFLGGTSARDATGGIWEDLTGFGQPKQTVLENAAPSYVVD